MTCCDYSPGPIPGKTMAICRHYILAPKEAAGSCKLPGHFMCEEWLAALGRKVAAARPPSRGITVEDVLKAFPGSRVVDQRPVRKYATT